MGVHQDPSVIVPGYAAIEHVGIHPPQCHSAIAGTTHSHCVTTTHPGDGEDPVLMALTVTQAYGVQGGQLVDCQAVRVFAHGGQKRLGGIQLNGVDAAARLDPDQPSSPVPHERDARYLPRLHIHYEERVALGAAHYLPGVQPLGSKHLVEGAQGQLALAQQLGQLPHGIGTQLALEARETLVALRAQLVAFQVVHQRAPRCWSFLLLGQQWALAIRRLQVLRRRARGGHLDGWRFPFPATCFAAGPWWATGEWRRQCWRRRVALAVAAAPPTQAGTRALKGQEAGSTGQRKAY